MAGERMKSAKLQLRLDEKLLEKVRKECEKEYRTLSEVVRQLLNEWMERKNGN
jgi:Arc/MetJ-type ribon-helix-helix transcriptional regulator